MARLRKGDLVEVCRGKDRGKRGKILGMLMGREAAIVERLNLSKHFERRSGTDRPGGVIERESPIVLAALNLVCNRCGRGVRTGWKIGQDGTKQRVCARCGEVL